MPDEEGGYTPEAGPDTASYNEDAGGQAVETPQESYTPDWNWEEYADKRIPVKVDGAEQYVPLRDARDGYMRHSDYTRKTQEVAQRSQELEYADAVIQSLRLNPQDTIEFLQREWLESEGVTSGDQFEGQAGFDSDEEADPQQQAIDELYAWREQQEQTQAEQMIYDEMTQLEQRFGSDYDWNSVLEHAISTNAPNVTTAFKDMYFDTAFAEAQAVRDARAAKEAESQAQRDQAQQNAQQAGIVHHGGSVSSNGVSSGPSDGRMSVREAWMASRQSHG